MVWAGGGDHVMFMQVELEDVTLKFWGEREGTPSLVLTIVSGLH